ncbi:MAG: poly[(R)-3-hydroxyalkanoate] polymerase subunit PhaC [Pseudonocardiales bacterium]|nr:poly[(R)-3-hydroxyalkanoate] polymerase subunit PhaC [Pseudonocardiales bacterium]
MARRNSSERHNTDDNNDHSEVGGGEPVGLPSATQAIESLAAVLSRGGAVSQELIGLATELGRVLIGTSTLAPAERDRRFTDPAWSRNPLFRRLVQAYLAAAGSLDALVDDLDAHV